MSSTEPVGWRQLKTSHSTKQLPQLFYIFSASGSGLTLQLTDQVRLWQCSLSKADINSRAAEQHCSIDPSESADQMSVFLRKIEESLETGKNGLVRRGGGGATTGSESENEICLSTRLGLPRPLAPLVFVFSLDLASPSLFSRTVVKPVLATIVALQSRLSSLEHHIQEKDHVISKLLDRIKSQSIDMSMIFPTLTGVGGRNGTVTVEMAKKRIAGMEVFDRQAWDSEFERSDGGFVKVGDLLKGVGGGGEAVSKEEEDDVDENWVRQLPWQSPEELTRMKNASQSQSQTGTQEVYGNQKGAAFSSEDEFERQATPPGLRKKRASPATKETSSRDQASSSPDRDDARHPAKKQRIGGLRRRKPEPDPDPDPVKSEPATAVETKTGDKKQSQSLPVHDDSTETASSSSEEDKPGRKSQLRKQKTQPVRSIPQKPPSLSPSPSATASTRSPSPVAQPKPPLPTSKPPPRRLGRLGKKAVHQPANSSSPSPEADSKRAVAAAAAAASQSTAATSATVTKRLGRIGAKKQTQLQSKPAAPVDDSATASDDDDDLDPHPSTQYPSKSLTNKVDTKQEPSPSPPPQKPPQPQPPPPPPAEPKLPETEEQKAARRKEELRKTMASGPTKKKRRF